MSDEYAWARFLKDNPHISVSELLEQLDQPQLQILQTDDIVPDIDQLYESGRDVGISAGWISVDPFYRISPGFWTLVTGWPNMGKSSMVDNIAINTMVQQNWRWLFFSAENRPYAAHWASLAELYTGEPFDKSDPFRMSRSTLQRAKDFLSQHAFHVYIDDETPMTVKRILDVGRKAIDQYKINAMVIDPWNELEHRRPFGMNETEYVSAALSQVRSMARSTGIHVFVVAHPAKRERAKDGSLPIPTPHDVSGSAHFWNKADYGLCVHRDFSDRTGETQLFVQKARHRWVAKLGSVSLFHDWRTNRYIDPLTRTASRYGREPGDEEV